MSGPTIPDSAPCGWSEGAGKGIVAVNLSTDFVDQAQGPLRTICTMVEERHRCTRPWVRDVDISVAAEPTILCPLVLNC